MDNILNSIYLSEIINKAPLNEKQIAVLELRYCHNCTLKATAEELGVGPQRVHQIEAKALRILRSTVNLMAI